MASLNPRVNKDGIVTGHPVKWRMDGTGQTGTLLPGST